MYPNNKLHITYFSVIILLLCALVVSLLLLYKQDPFFGGVLGKNNPAPVSITVKDKAIERATAIYDISGKINSIEPSPNTNILFWTIIPNASPTKSYKIQVPKDLDIYNADPLKTSTSSAIQRIKVEDIQIGTNLKVSLSSKSNSEMPLAGQIILINP